MLAEEADPRLPPGSLHLDGGLARRLARAPPRDALIAALREEGYAAARCHLEVGVGHGGAGYVGVVGIGLARGYRGQRGYGRGAPAVEVLRWPR